MPDLRSRLLCGECRDLDNPGQKDTLYRSVYRSTENLSWYPCPVPSRGKRKTLHPHGLMESYPIYKSRLRRSMVHGRGTSNKQMVYHSDAIEEGNYPSIPKWPLC